MRASLVVLTYNQLEDGTKPCIESIYRNTNINDFELIIVDNNSSDGTKEYLKYLGNKYSNVKIQLNTINKGYAAGNNDGMLLAEADYIVLLNNDILVTPRWLDNLLCNFEKDSQIGLIGPITNSVGNEQIVNIKDIAEENYEYLAREYTEKNKEVICETEKLGFFAVAIRREIIERVGLLDDNFGIGMFEDDDYCIRVRNLGYKLIFTEGCFIYHKGSLSFNKLTVETYQEIFEKNRNYFFSKHGIHWSFTDLAYGFFNKIQKDLNQYIEENSSNIDRNIERVLVRFENLGHLLFRIKQIEINKNNANPIMHKKMLQQLKWELRIKKFKMEFINGSLKQKIRYIDKIAQKIVSKIYKKKKSNDIAKILGNMRRKDPTEKVVIIPATIDYNYMVQRPQQIAKALAEKGFLVIYGTLNTKTDHVKISKRVQKNLYLLNEIYFPWLFHLAKEEEIIYYCMWPNNVKHLEYIKAEKVIYDYMDDLSILKLSNMEVESYHNTILERADLITVSSTKLIEELGQPYKNKAILVNNAVSKEFINSINKAKAAKYLLKIKKENKIIIGYYGAIASWIDFDLIEYLVKKMDDCHFVFIGPIFKVQEKIEKITKQYSNISFLKEMNHKDLVKYLKGFDICIIPFIKNSITDAVSPVKLFEYMASGHPIVTSDMEECKKYDSVLIAKSKELFLQKIKQAILLNKDDKYKNLIQQEAQENTWEKRIEATLSNI
jgi:GT2 family glycosyltransferase/galactitol-specific phosphotransferase system IIB component